MISVSTCGSALLLSVAGDVDACDAVALRNAIATDGHSPAQWRTYTVRNLDAWYDAFGVKPGQKLYLAPEQRVRVW